MPGLLQAATVIEGNGDWMRGPYGIESWGCALGGSVTDICPPGTPTLAWGADNLAAAGKAGSMTVVPFGYIVGLQRSTKCETGSEMQKALESIARSEAVIGGVFSDKLKPSNVVNLMTVDANAPASTKVTAGADLSASLEALLKAYGDKHGSWDDALVHLSLDEAFKITQDIEERLEIVGIDKNHIVVSPGYAAGLIAVTGPITVRLSSVEIHQKYDTTKNLNNIEASRLAAIEFDPCLAFHV